MSNLLKISLGLAALIWISPWGLYLIKMFQGSSSGYLDAMGRLGIVIIWLIAVFLLSGTGLSLAITHWLKLNSASWSLILAITLNAIPFLLILILCFLKWLSD